MSALKYARKHSWQLSDHVTMWSEWLTTKTPLKFLCSTCQRAERGGSLAHLGDFVPRELCVPFAFETRNFVYFSTVTPKNGFKIDKSVRTCRPTNVFSRAFLRNTKGVGKKAQKDMDGERRVWNLTRLEEDLLIWDWFNVCEASAFSWALETRKVRHQLSCYQVEGSYLFPECCHLFSWFSIEAALVLFCKRVLLFCRLLEVEIMDQRHVGMKSSTVEKEALHNSLTMPGSGLFKFSGWGLYGYPFNNREDDGYVSPLHLSQHVKNRKERKLSS